MLEGSASISVRANLTLKLFPIRYKFPVCEGYGEAAQIGT
jgi:hypothetical protein